MTEAKSFSIRNAVCRLKLQCREIKTINTIYGLQFAAIPIALDSKCLPKHGMGWGTGKRNILQLWLQHDEIQHANVIYLHNFNLIF